MSDHLTADVLTQDRETIAAEAINVLGELLLPHISPIHRVYIQKLWTQFGPIAIKRAVIRAPTLTVVDERTPGAPSSVELVDERGPSGLREVQAKANG